MAKPSESAKYGYTYIPPSVQKSIQSHMDRTMPVHLKKYQQGSRFIPHHAEKAMSQHMQKNLPSHLKKYADPYLYQNVVYPAAAGNSAAFSTPSASPSTPQRSARPLSSTYGPRQGQAFSGNDDASQAAQSQQSPGQQPADSQDTDPYGFIMNPQKPPRQPFTLPGDSMGVRIAFAAGGLIVLIILFSIGSSFLNKSSNLQKQKLLSLAQTQSEIVGVADTASEKINDKDLLYRAATVKVTLESSQQQVISALQKRGKKKIKDKELNVKNPADDAALSEGEQNGRYDEAYTQLLQKLLSDYQLKLKAVYDSGTASEKEIASTANEQIKMLLSGLN